MYISSQLLVYTQFPVQEAVRMELVAQQIIIVMAQLACVRLYSSILPLPKAFFDTYIKRLVRRLCILLHCQFRDNGVTTNIVSCVSQPRYVSSSSKVQSDVRTFKLSGPWAPWNQVLSPRNQLVQAPVVRMSTISVNNSRHGRSTSPHGFALLDMSSTHGVSASLSPQIVKQLY